MCTGYASVTSASQRERCTTKSRVNTGSLAVAMKLPFATTKNMVDSIALSRASTGRCWIRGVVGMQAAVCRGQRLPQELQVAQSIAIVEEAGQAVVAALHHVLRNAGQVDARGRAMPVSMCMLMVGRSPCIPEPCFGYRHRTL
jgi:hypothetical protein